MTKVAVVFHSGYGHTLRMGRPVPSPRAAPGPAGTVRRDSIARPAARRDSVRSLKVAAVCVGPNRYDSGLCQRPQFVPTNGHRALWHPTKRPMPQQAIRREAAQWGRGQSGQCRLSQRRACSRQTTDSASSRPEMNASSTRVPRHQSPQTPMLSLSSHRCEWPKGCTVCA